MTDQQSRIVNALVGAKHGERFHRSAAFHHAINQLAAMLPAMVDGLAIAADDADADMQRMIDVAKQIDIPKWGMEQ